MFWLLKLCSAHHHTYLSEFTVSFYSLQPSPSHRHHRVLHKPFYLYMLLFYHFTSYAFILFPHIFLAPSRSYYIVTCFRRAKPKLCLPPKVCLWNYHCSYPESFNNISYKTTKNSLHNECCRIFHRMFYLKTQKNYCYNQNTGWKQSLFFPHQRKLK